MIRKSFVLPLLTLFASATDNGSIAATHKNTIAEKPAVHRSSSAHTSVSLPTQVKPVPDSLFNKYYDATGGQKLWKEIKTYTTHQKLSSSSSVNYDVVVNADLANQSVHKSRIAMKREFIYVAKPNDGWLKIPLGSSDKATKYQVNGLNATEKSNLVSEMYNSLLPFYDYKSRGLIASYAGTETINGKKVEHVELQGKGAVYNLYFDGQTHLLARVREKSDGVEYIRTYSDYVKSKSGISYASKIVETNSKDKKSTTISVTDLVINPVFDQALFQK